MTLFSRSAARPALGLLAAVALAAAGCSSGTEKVTVEGTVRYRGEPVRSGILRVVGPDGSFSTAPIRSDGTFTLTDVVPGEVKVGIMEEPQAAGSSSDGKSAAGAPKRAAPLPPKVADPEKSGLQYTIEPGARQLNIEIN